MTSPRHDVELHAQLATRRRQNDLAFHVAARTAEVSHAVAALAQGDDGEHAPQTIPALQIVLALGMVAVTALIAVMIRLTLRGTRATAVQAATGFFYLAVITAFAGELAAKVRFLP